MAIECPYNLVPHRGSSEAVRQAFIILGSSKLVTGMFLLVFPSPERSRQMSLNARRLDRVCMLFLMCSIFALPVGAQSDDVETTPSSSPAQQASMAAGSNPSSFLADVGSLEFRVFGHQYADQDIASRLDRLERVVYGSRKTAPLEVRIENLMRDVYSAQSPASSQVNAQNSTASGITTDASAAAISPSQQPTSLVEIIASMENEVFGKTYPQDKLLERVSRLEKSVLPNGTEQSFTPLPTRIRNLLTALQPAIRSPEIQTTTALSPAPQYLNRTEAQNENRPAKVSESKDENGHPIIKKLGQILSGVGTVAGEAIGSMAYGTAIGYGSYGWGYPGYFGGYGWGPYYGGNGYGYGIPFCGYRW